MLAGEPGFEVDTYRLKIGDGKTAWNDLPYIGTTGSGPIVLPDNIMSYLGKITSFHQPFSLELALESLVVEDTYHFCLSLLPDIRQHLP